MEGLGSAVWERTGVGTMSQRLYAFMVCFWSAFGIGQSAVGAYLARDWQLTWPFLIVVLVSAIAGVIISLKSDMPIVSLIGYAMIAVPFGLMLGPIVALYTAASVFKVFFLTTLMVGGLGFVGATIPDSLENWGGPLFGGLILLLGGLFLVPIAGYFGVPVEGAMTALDWFGLVLFGALVLYDLNRAMRIPYTMDNAIDSAIGIYLDFINIFIRLLSLMGKKK